LGISNLGNKKALGYKHTKDAISKISESIKKEKHWSWKGGKPKCSVCGKTTSQYGCVVCSGCKSVLYRGENSPNWKNGISFNKKYLSWIKNKRNRIIKRLKVSDMSHTFGEWELLKKQYNHTCPCCQKSEPEIKLTEDHIIPLSRGGSDLIENIQPLCLGCNVKKHTNIIKY